VGLEPAHVSPSLPDMTVIKLGGAVLDDPTTVDYVWSQIATLRGAGPVLVVHGGGQQATQLAGRLGHVPRILHGRRVTTDLDLNIALWAFRGALNTALIASATRHGVPAAGLSGVDGGTLVVRRRPPREVDGEVVDFGWVGDVDHVNPALLRVLIDGGIVPVVAPLGVDVSGRIYNVNADTVAVAIAEAVDASTLLMVATSGGLRRDAEDAGSHCPECDPALVASGVAEGWITAGMRVKLETALGAARTVPNVYIVPPDALTAPQCGTRVRADASYAP
jgi:acetylglutamate kinase